MAWVNWTRRATPAASRAAGMLGIEMSASLARAATGRAAHNRSVPLDDPHDDLPLTIALDKRAPEVGRAGNGLVRKLPHLVCAGYLPHLGEAREWKGRRHSLTAVDALGLALDRLRAATSDFGGVFIGLPSYLSRTQIAKLKSAATRVRLPIKGSVSSALALAADRAPALLAQPPRQELREEGIVPLHRPCEKPWPADAIVVDADCYALTGSLIRIEPNEVSVVATTALPRVGVKAWLDRLVDALADRCVRVCRRDPRDSAEAEQSLFEQIDAGLEYLASGQPVSLTVRAAHWHQDMRLRPEDFEACCPALIRSSVEGLRALLHAGSAVEPPRAVWMTHEAGRLPGLAQAIYQNMSERTSVGVLRPEAPAIAIANLGEHWPAGEHLDASIPIRVKAPVDTPAARSIASKEIL